MAGAIEITDDRWARARLSIIADATAKSLGDFIRSGITEGSTVVSDGWGSYPSALSGYGHEPFNVSTTGNPAHEVLPAVHRLFAQVKNTLDGTYQDAQKPEHLQEYLNEFVFRFNGRNSRSRGLLFLRLLERAVTSAPATYRSLVRTPVHKRACPTGVSGPRRRPGTLDLPPADRPWRHSTTDERNL